MCCGCSRRFVWGPGRRQRVGSKSSLRHALLPYRRGLGLAADTPKRSVRGRDSRYNRPKQIYIKQNNKLILIILMIITIAITIYLSIQTNIKCALQLLQKTPRDTREHKEARARVLRQSELGSKVGSWPRMGPAEPRTDSLPPSLNHIQKWRGLRPRDLECNPRHCCR